ncbi:MAG: tyrosine-type recombinase/integrase [Oscillospiraceae bacterium]|nr:tyrosine-type recombinase/integrase [Oscillospiraceae bacterium]
MTTEPIRDIEDTTALAMYYKKRGEYRNYVLIIMGMYTALRISDLLGLTWNDVFDFKHSQIKKTLHLTERKTGKIQILALNVEIISALTLFASKLQTPVYPGGVLFKSRKTEKAIGRIQAYRIIRHAAEELSIKHRISCHSLRKTFGYHAWKKGVSPAIIMEIYNHSSLAVTRRYLGVTQDDKNEVYLGLDLML